MHDLTTFNWTILLAAVFAVAFFYSSVGHGGATGYLAAITLVIAPAILEKNLVSVKVSVLIVNVCVASIAWWRFWKAGHFDGRVLLTFAVASVPCAVLGSKIHISPQNYKIILGAVLSVAGLVLLFRSRWQTNEVAVKKCFWPVALLVGAVLGFLAGLTGIGGGVFLSPVLYLFRWVKPKTTGGIAAGFIVLNSLAGLAGAGWEKITHAGPLLWLTLPAAIGALLGTHFGARRWSSVTFSRVLAGVLVFAGGKLLLEAASPNSFVMRVLFFAQLQDVTGCAATELAAPSPLNREQLWAMLLEKFPGLLGHRGNVRLARNWEYADEETRFGDGDEVALIPPVSGG